MPISHGWTVLPLPRRDGACPRPRPCVGVRWSAGWSDNQRETIPIVTLADQRSLTSQESGDILFPYNTTGGLYENVSSVGIDCGNWRYSPVPKNNEIRKSQAMEATQERV